ncbi:RICIN domain-containing protein [Lentzea alba]|uniref:ricin-type beta-trefoil lectin domain protein n=1 Tax=Lentzea alba TaxID=2714351 RepID=UPI0039BFABE5
MGAVAAVGAMLIAPVPASAAQDQGGITKVYRIQHEDTRKCLDANSDRKVGLADCDGTSWQDWDNYAPGRFKHLATGLCLASDGAEVFTMPCGTPSSTWTIPAVAPGSPRHIRHGVEATECLHTSSGSPGTFGDLTDCATGTRWYVI